MPLTELDPNIAGRTSRASNFSDASKATSRPYSPKADLLSTNPAVMSMLRTSTETGDIGSFSYKSTRRTAGYRPPRRSGGSPRPSTSSSNYKSSISQGSRSLGRYHGISSIPNGHRSLTSSLHQPHYSNGTLSPLGFYDDGFSSAMMSHRSPREVRSYSMTGSVQPLKPVSSHRSLTSLRSHAAQIQRPRSPYVYPMRPKRPGYRPTSPAMSETTGVQRLRSQYVRRPTRQPLIVPPTPNMAISSTSSESPSSNIPTPPKPCPSPNFEVRANGEVEIVDAECQPEHNETYQNEAGFKPRSSVQSMGFVQRIRSILDERSSVVVEQVSESRSATAGINNVEAPQDSTSAQPVVKRITREMILEATQPSSEKAADETTTSVSEVQAEFGPSPRGSSACGFDDSHSKDNAPVWTDDKIIKEQNELTVASSKEQTPAAFQPDQNSVGSQGANNDMPVDSKILMATSPQESNECKTEDQTTKSEQATDGDAKEERITEGYASSSPPSYTGDQLSSSPTNIASRASIISSPTVTSSEEASPTSLEDCAIRFSLPKQNAAIRIEDVSSKAPAESSTLDRSKSVNAETTTLRLNRVKTSITIHKSTTPANSMESFSGEVGPTSTSLNYRKSIGAVVPKREQVWDANRVSNSSTTDLRFSAFCQPSPLPDLKEESVEDISISQPHLSITKFPLPGSLPANRNSEGNSSAGGSSRGVFKARSDALQRSRAIPSLNFSSMDLFSKLNEALDLHSVDGLPFDIRDLSSSAADRPPSMNTVRQRYKSWFADYEDIFSSKRESSALGASGRQTISPEEFISEVNQLSVPSVTVLTERLTELLPSIKSYLLDDTEFVREDVENALKDIRALGQREAGTVSSENALDEGTDLSSTTEILSNRETRQINSIASTGASLSQKQVESSDFDKILSGVTDGDVSDKDGKTEENDKSRNQMIEEQTSQELKSPSVKSASITPRSRPWNDSSNYPWTDNSPKIDICFPIKSKKRSSGTLTPGHRAMVSTSTIHTSGPNDVGAKENLKALRHSQSHGDIAKHASKASRRSILDSVSQRLGLHSSHGSQGTFSPDLLPSEERTVKPGDRYPTSALKPPSALNLDDVRSFFSDDSSQTEHVGNFRKRLTGRKSKRSHISRVFSSESRINGNTNSRSNFSQAKNDSKYGFGTSGNLPGNYGGNLVSNDVPSASVLGGSGVSVHSFELTAGMSKVEFRARKVVEKVKFLWFCGGELVRSISRRNKATPTRTAEQGQVDDRWLDDSDFNLGN